MARDDRETSQSQAESELKVTDRRLFTSDGQLRADAVDEIEETETEGAEPGTETPAGEEVREHGFERHSVEEPAGVDFTMLINAMAEPALLFLGEIPHPGTGQPSVDLQRARLQIDMLDLLRVKCRGNLNAEEEGLLDRILYQLRMLYVTRSNQPES
jgi:hypothetical protein